MASPPQVNGEEPVAQDRPPALTSRINQEDDAVAQLNRCRIWDKLRKGELHLITRENVEELVSALDANETGEITKEDLKELQSVPDLELTDEDIDEIARDCDKDQSGRISVEELHKALTTGSISYKKVLEALRKTPPMRKPTECTRDQLVQFLHEEYEVTSALWALPTTFLGLLIYMVCVHFHLRVDTAYEMQHAIVHAVESEGNAARGNYLRTYVIDVPTYWYWMNTSFVDATFKDNTAVFPYPGRFASYNQMIGGVLFEKHFTTPEQCTQSSRLFLNYDTQYGPGFCHKLGEEQERKEWLLYHFSPTYIREQIGTLWNSRWIDQNVTKVMHRALFYNAHVNAFTSYRMEFTFRADGKVTIIPDMETFLSDPYFDKWVVAFDTVFVILLVRVFWSEIKELVPACMNGFDGFLEYMGFWNAIDWMNLCFGVACISLWALVCTTVGGSLQENIANLPTSQLDKYVIGNGYIGDLTTFERETGGRAIADYTNKLEEVLNVSDYVARVHSWLRWVLVFYSMSLMLKFFKAFRANPRLNIVIDTITESWVDICHFGLVFGVIFVVFAIMAQLAFGASIVQFHTLDKSLMMCWRVLMGDFDVDGMMQVSSFLASLWFVLFTGLVLLILLNMLLAIIMDTYTGVKSKKASPRTIWNQWRDAISTVRETQGHLPLWNLICEFEDDGMPAHPGKHVTLRSLRRAFEKDKMTRHNAEYLVRKTVDYITEKEGESELTMSDAIRLLGQLRTQVWKSSENSTEAVHLLRKMDQAPHQARLDAILAGEEPDVAKPPVVGNAGSIARGVPFNGQGQGDGRRSSFSGAGMGGGGFGNMGFSAAARGSHFSHLPASQAYLTAPGGIQRRLSGMGGELAVANGDSFRGKQDFMQHHPHMPMGMHMTMGSDDYSLAEMGMTVQSLHKVLEDQRRHTREHDDWLDKRISAMERRCDTVEQVGERLYRLLNNLDPEGLSTMPEKVDHILKEQKRQMDILFDRDRSSDIHASPGSEVPPARSSDSGDLSMQRMDMVETKLQQISDQVTQLVSHAEEASETRKLLWRIDLNLRQLKQEGNHHRDSGPTSPHLSNTTGASGFRGVGVAPRRNEM